MSVQGIIFDFDGVIVDSEYRFTRGVKDVVSKYGIDASEEELTQLPGQPIPCIITTMKRIFHLDDMTEEEIMTDMREMYMHLNEKELQPVKGIEAFMKAVRQKGIRCALATSAGIPHIEEAMAQAGLDFDFDVIVTFDDVQHGKPDPEIFLKAAEKLQLPKESLIIVEDSYNGVLAGSRSGIFTFGLKASIIIQDTSRADREVTGYDEILQYIEELEKEENE